MSKPVHRSVLQEILDPTGYPVETGVADDQKSPLGFPLRQCSHNCLFKLVWSVARVASSDLVRFVCAAAQRQILLLTLADCGRRPGPFFTRRDDDNMTPDDLGCCDRPYKPPCAPWSVFTCRRHEKPCIAHRRKWQPLCVIALRTIATPRRASSIDDVSSVKP